MIWTTIWGWEYWFDNYKSKDYIQVKNFLDELDTDNKTVTLEEFKELMVALEEAGWRKQKPKKVTDCPRLCYLPPSPINIKIYLLYFHAID